MCIEPENEERRANAVLTLDHGPETVGLRGVKDRTLVIENFDRDRLAMRHQALLGRAIAGLHCSSEKSA
jgi:hypothetical protein